MGLFDDWLRARRLRRTLSEALEVERERVGGEQAKVIADFIEHGEFMLAHDQIIDALEDRGFALMPQSQALLLASNKLMGQIDENDR